MIRATLTGMGAGTATTDLSAELQRLFGFERFRPGQREAIEGTLSGRDVLAIMPTGSGKSLCYQLPALLGDGVTLVVSPLIALMQDQSAALRAGGHEDVEMIASSMTGEQVGVALARIAAGRRAPGLRRPRAVLQPPLPGRDRPGQRRPPRDRRGALPVGVGARLPARLPAAVGRAQAARHSPPTLALTATATPRVARDIVSALELRDPVMATHRLRPPQPVLGGAARGRRGRQAAHAAGAPEGPQAAPGRRLLRPPQDLRAGGRAPARRRHQRRALPRRPAPARAHGHAPAVPGRRAGGGRRHHRVRHGHRQGRRALGRALDDPVLARGVLPAGGPRRPRRCCPRSARCSTPPPTRA